MYDGEFLRMVCQEKTVTFDIILDKLFNLLYVIGISG